ncbi:hypothetical protein [Pseudomonas entomophila]|uniref:hypothetical protein n=1 Tax=Pseudomonas entomophila TaxID=312306 RepID=UPI001F01CBD3|nr:hypothetical protein [Pseudomonas entomophila]MCG8291983.1 hypothetical protein [Pseudomonas entomophila]
MAAQYGIRTRDASGAVTLDTTVTPIRSLKMMQVVGNGAFDQYIAIPEIKAESFVVVDTLEDAGLFTFSPAAWWTEGQLQLRQPQNKTWQVMILSKGGEPHSATGTYGIRTKNNGIAMQIDAVNKALTIRYSGKFSFIYGSGDLNIEGDDYRSFPSPITTYERPLIFINANDYFMVGQFSVIGSPGNWTGFRLRDFRNEAHGTGWNLPIRISWFCASYMTDSSPAGQYGISVRGPAGERLFASTMNLTALNSQPTANSFVTAGDPIVRPGYYATSQQMAWTGNYADFILANALFSQTNLTQTTQPLRINFGGFLPGNRSVLQMYCENNDGVNPVLANGRTLFAARPMRSIF